MTLRVVCALFRVKSARDSESRTTLRVVRVARAAERLFADEKPWFWLLWDSGSGERRARLGESRDSPSRACRSCSGASFR